LTTGAGARRKGAMDGHAREELIDRSLRALVSLCAALLGGAWLCAALVVVLIVRAGGELYADRPPTFPFLLALGAMIAVLLSSAARTAILRRAVEREEEARAMEEEEGVREEEVRAAEEEEGVREEEVRAAEEEEGVRAEEEGVGAAGAWVPHDRQDARLARRLAAYVRATQVSFGMQAAAAAGGLTAALVGGVPLYGLMVCTTSALAMSARWPRRVVVEDFVDSGLPPEPRRGR
jgi:hypothetical protein